MDYGEFLRIRWAKTLWRAWLVRGDLCNATHPRLVLHDWELYRGGRKNIERNLARDERVPEYIAGVRRRLNC